MLIRQKAIIGTIILLAAAIIVFNPLTRSLTKNVQNVTDGSMPGIKSINNFSLAGVAEELTIAADVNPSAPVVTARKGIEKKIIKTGDLSIKVDEAQKAAEIIANIAKANQGDVYGSNFYKNIRGAMSGSIILHVPSNNFEKTFSELKAVAVELISESTNAQDVTEQYIDLEARLKNKIAEEKSFSELLKKSGTMEDVLGVTRELARVRGEIEQL